MIPNSLRRASALAVSLTLAAGMALVAAPAAQALPVSSDASLAGITVSTGTVVVPFNADPGIAMQVTLPNATDRMAFTPTASDSGATILAFNGRDAKHVVASGTPSWPGIVIAGTTSLMTAEVTAADGVTTAQYQILVTREALPPAPTYDLSLDGLAVSEGALSPTFSSNVLDYSVDVPYNTTSITIAPGTSAGNTVTVRDSGNQMGPIIRLSVGGNLAVVRVTAPDNISFQEYLVHITRGAAPTANVDLADIELSVGTLSPEFDPTVTSYSATVPYAVRSMQITATAAIPGNTITINNVEVADGEPATVPLIFDAGGNGFAIAITAPNTATKSYNIRITRDQPSNNADLTSLDLSTGPLSPAFSNAETAYTAAVPYLTTSASVTATVADGTAILRVNGRDTASGDASAPVALAVGANTITVSATAEDGVTETTREIVVTRAAPDLDLSALTVTGGTLSPAFAADTLAYSIALPYTTSTIDIAATAVNPDWTLRINGTPTAATSVAVPVGASSIPVTVTATHGETRVYTIAITREAPSTNATLGGLTLSDGSLSPAFSAAETSYTATVGHLTDEITVGATAAESTASLTINGDPVASSDVSLAVGPNTITIVTIAQDGTTTQTTTVVVTREAAPKPPVLSDDATLNRITLSDGTLSPAFSAGATSYSASVGYLTTEVTVGATAAQATTSLTINGTAAASATVALSVGANTIAIVTTAEDGTTQTTTVVVTRAVAPTPAVVFNLGFEAGDAAADAPFEVNARNLQPGSTATITMHSTPVVLATGTVQADGTITLSAQIPANAETGAHRLVFSGIAADGAAVSQTAWLTVLSDGTIGDTSLTEPVAYVEPETTPTPKPTPVPAPSGSSSPLASTGVESGFGAMAGASLATLGAALLLLGGVLRRRRSAA